MSYVNKKGKSEMQVARQTGQHSGAKHLVQAIDPTTEPLLPDPFKYNQELAYAVNVEWEDVRVPAREKQPVGPNDKIHIVVEDDMIARMDTALLSFDVETTVTAAGLAAQPDSTRNYNWTKSQASTSGGWVLTYTSPYTGKSASVIAVFNETLINLSNLVKGLSTWDDAPDGPYGDDLTFATNTLDAAAQTDVQYSGTIQNYLENITLAQHPLVIQSEAQGAGGATSINLTGNNNGFHGYRRMEKGIWNWIDRVEVRWGSEESDDIRQYNLLTSWFMSTQTDLRWEDLAGRAMFGYKTDGARNADAKVIKRYGLFLYTNVFCKGAIPLPYIVKELRIILHTADVNECMESNYTTANAVSYNIRNVELLYRKFNLNSNPGLAGSYLRALNDFSRPLAVSYQSPYDLPTHLNSGVTTFQIDITEKSKSMRHLLMIFRDQSQISGLAINDKHYNYLRNDVDEWQLKFNTRLIPRQPLEAEQDSEVFWDYLKQLDNWKFNQGQHAFKGTKGTSDFLTTKFYICFDLRSFPHEPMMSGISNIESHSQLRPQVRFNTPTAVAQEVAIWAISDTVLPYNIDMKRFI